MRLHDLDGDLAEFDPHNPEHYLDDEAYDVPVNPADRERDVLFLVRRLAENKRRVAECKATVAIEQERWEEWEKDRTAGLLREIVRLENAIEQWQRMDGRLTFTTPYGVTSRLKERPAHLEVDIAKFIPWALRNRPEWLKVEPKLADIKRVTTPGAVIDGYKSVEDEPATAISLVTGSEEEGDREIVPGVALVTPIERNFSI